MGTLKEKLINFEKQIENISNAKELNATKLQEMFRELAPAFLYGGYIKVRDDYKVYIRTVEFYFHSEKEEWIHDPIVYHRNKRDYDGYILEDVPYFPIMTLHAHNSGFDITFESKKEKYRASALIRSYEVKNKDGLCLVWNKIEHTFETKINGYNPQSTYLYDLLNGFSVGNNNEIIWQDEIRKQSKEPKIEKRQNVFQSYSEFEYKKIEKKFCERLWSFTREEQI